MSALRIGLLRHFPVPLGMPSGWLSARDLQRWRADYDSAEVAVGAFDLGGIDWQHCLASDLPRTRRTAAEVFAGTIEHTALLREPSLPDFRTGGLRLPALGWQLLWRGAWLLNHASQRATRADFERRVAAAADHLCGLRGDVLVVSHAGMMAMLSAELRRRGFTGPRLRIAAHARAYVYSRAG